MTISDDASTDETIEIARRMLNPVSIGGKEASAIQHQIIQHEPALGVAANFESAISLAKSRNILLADQDDVWFPDHRHVLLRELEQMQPVALVHTDAILIDDSSLPIGATLFGRLKVKKKEIRRIRSGNAAEVFLRRNLVTGATSGITKELARIAFPVPEGWIHDEWLALVCSFHGEVRIVPRPTISYRQHESNQIGARKLGVRHAVARLIYPRAERNAVLLKRAQNASAHRAFTEGQPGAQQIRQKLEHELVRSSYPAPRWRRILPIIREISTGRYAVYGLGLQDVLRDILQPV